MRPGWFLDSRPIRALPDVSVRGFVVRRMGYNFRPDWDRDLCQPWFGHWWVWLGPYLIGWPTDFSERMKYKGAGSALKCSCAQTENSMWSCPVHGEGADEL